MSSLLLREATSFDIASAEFPSGTVHTMSSNEHVEVEADGEVRTQ